jgi:hypothetical protein
MANGTRILQTSLLLMFLQPIAAHTQTRPPEGSGTAIVRIGRGAGGYAPKRLLSKRIRQVPIAEVAGFLEFLKKRDFWNQSTEPPPSDSIGCDGTGRVVEGNASTYHVVDRWEGSSLHDIGTYMLKTIGQVKLDGPI